MQMHEGHLRPSVANRLFAKPCLEGIQGERELGGLYARLAETLLPRIRMKRQEAKGAALASLSRPGGTLRVIAAHPDKLELVAIAAPDRWFMTKMRPMPRSSRPG